MTRFLYIAHWAALLLFPVRVLSGGPKRSRVKLRFGGAFEGVRHKAGAVITVPTHALGGTHPEAMYATGRGGFRRWNTRRELAAYLKRVGFDHGCASGAGAR